jgi:hypothetical protein
MKFQLGEKDYLEKHHLYGLIVNYARENHGTHPEYIIVHPATYYKIIMLTNERNDEFAYHVVDFRHGIEKPATKIYGINFIRSADVEEDFVILT